MKTVIVIRNINENEELEARFESDVMPMAKYFADCWAKRNGYRLIKSPRKIAELFPCHRIAVSKSEVIFYAV